MKIYAWLFSFPLLSPERSLKSNSSSVGRCRHIWACLTKTVIYILTFLGFTWQIQKQNNSFCLIWNCLTFIVEDSSATRPIRQSRAFSCNFENFTFIWVLLTKTIWKENLTFFYSYIYIFYQKAKTTTSIFPRYY